MPLTELSVPFCIAGGVDSLVCVAREEKAVGSSLFIEPTPG